MKLEDLKPGDILLCPPTKLPGGWVGHAIVLLTGGKVSHTAVYCGEKSGEARIAHSDLRGIFSMSLKEFLDEEPGCYLMRYKDQTDLQPVLDALDTYADKGNPYPVMNFAVLGLLIIGNRLAKDTLKNRIFYDFALLVGLKIIKEINKHKYPGKDAMTCSQFASQCFTDAGELYDIKFEKLLLQFKQLNNIENSDEDTASLFDYINTDEENDLLMDSDEEDTIMNNEEQVVSRFIDLMQNNINEFQLESVSDKKLSKVASKLLMAICEAITGKKPASVADAIEKLSSNRNYFVTPDDLLTNTKNLEAKGYFDKTIFSK